MKPCERLYYCCTGVLLGIRETGNYYKIGVLLGLY